MTVMKLPRLAGVLLTLPLLASLVGILLCIKSVIVFTYCGTATKPIAISICFTETYGLTQLLVYVPLQLITIISQCLSQNPTRNPFGQKRCCDVQWYLFWNRHLRSNTCIVVRFKSVHVRAARCRLNSLCDSCASRPR